MKGWSKTTRPPSPMCYFLAEHIWNTTCREMEQIDTLKDTENQLPDLG
jgi:hypothetical protein